METALYLIALFGLAYAGSILFDLFVQRISIKNILHILGIEYIILGIVLGPNLLDLLSQKILLQLEPVIGLGIGWAGLLFGSQLNFPDLKKFPKFYIALSFGQGIGACLAVILTLLFWCTKSESFLGIKEIQPFLILAAASISTSPIIIGYLRSRIQTEERISSLVYFISATDGMWSILFFGAAYALVRPFENALSPWIYEVEWVIISVLLGLTIGYLFRILLRIKYTQNEFLLMVIGLVIFSSGSARYLGLSPLFVNFIIGVVIANTNEKKNQVQKILTVYEKIFYIIFLVLAGALWQYPGQMVFLVSIVYFLARAGGKWLGFFTGILFVKPLKKSFIPANLGLSFIPQGGVAIAMAIDYKGNFPGAQADLALSVILISVVLSHIFGPNLVKFFIKREAS